MYAELQSFQMFSKINNYDLSRQVAQSPVRLIPILKPSAKIQILVLPFDMIYVLSPIEDHHVLFGPMFITGLDDDKKSFLTKVYNTQLPDKFFEDIPLMKMDEIQSTFALIDVLFNHTTLQAAKNKFISYMLNSKNSLRKCAIRQKPLGVNDYYYVSDDILRCVGNGNTKDLMPLIDSLHEANNTGVDVDFYRLHIAGQLNIVGKCAIDHKVNDYIIHDIEENYLKELANLPDIASMHILLMQAIIRFSDEVKAASDSEDESGKLSDVVRYIGMHLNTSITLAEVAERYGYNASYFSRKFKQVFGDTFEHHVLHMRLEEAKRQLELTNLSISKIADALCFSSQSHLQRAFKSEYGITPLAYRRSVQNKL